MVDQKDLPQEIKIAVEAAFERVKQLQGKEGPLDVHDLVVYQTLGGTTYTCPFLVLSMDARTALLRGFMDNHDAPVELRVMRTQVARMEDLDAFVSSSLSEIFHCPHCADKDPTKPIGQKPSRRDN